jgi:hypothetical protein
MYVDPFAVFPDISILRRHSLSDPSAPRVSLPRILFETIQCLKHMTQRLLSSVPGLSDALWPIDWESIIMRVGAVEGIAECHEVVN